MSLIRLDCVAVLAFTMLAACSGSSIVEAPVVQKRGEIVLALGAGDPDSIAHSSPDIRGLAVDSQENAYVADAAGGRILVFGSQGTFLRSVGQTGQGPGDLSSPCCLALSPTGELWVEDFGNRRYSVYEVGSAGPRFVRSIAMPTGASGRLDRLSWNDSGAIAHVAAFFDSASGGFRLARSYLSAAGVEGRRDTLREPPKDSLSTFTVTRKTATGQGTSGINQPFGPTVLRAFGPGGATAYAVSSRYSVEWRDGAGLVFARPSRELEGPALSAGEKRRATALLDGIAQRLQIDRGAFPFDIPERKPPLRGLGFDLDGNLWVELNTSEGSDREADVYDRHGDLLAHVVWPAEVRFDQWAIKDWSALGVAVDSLGAQQVVRVNFR